MKLIKINKLNEKDFCNFLFEIIKKRNEIEEDKYKKGYISSPIREEIIKEKHDFLYKVYEIYNSFFNGKSYRFFKFHKYMENEISNYLLIKISLNDSINNLINNAWYRANINEPRDEGMKGVFY